MVVAGGGGGGGGGGDGGVSFVKSNELFPSVFHVNHYRG